MEKNSLFIQYLEFVFDKSKSVVLRVLSVIIIVSVLLLIDDYFKFSYNYKLNSEIEQISKIESIIKDTKDANLLQELKKIKKSILDTRGKMDYLSELFLSLKALLTNSSDKMSKNISANPIVHFFTSNLPLLIIVIILRQSLRKFILTKLIWWIILSGILIVFFGIFSGIITALIIPSNINEIFKILANILIQSIIMLLFYVSFSIYIKKTTKP